MSEMVSHESCAAVDASIRLGPHHGKAVLRGLWIELANAARGWSARRRNRRAMQDLVKLDEHLVKDMGISRAEALRKATDPFLML